MLLLALGAGAAVPGLHAAALDAAGRGVPFGLSPVMVRALIAAAALGYYGVRLRRDTLPRASLALGAVAAGFLLLAGLFTRIVEARASAFYTSEALADGMAVLLVLYGAGAMLRAWTASRTHHLSAATWLADDMTRGAVALVAAFWAVAALGLPGLAGIALLLAGIGGAVAFVLRVPDLFAAATETHPRTPAVHRHTRAPLRHRSVP